MTTPRHTWKSSGALQRARILNRIERNSHAPTPTVDCTSTLRRCPGSACHTVKHKTPRSILGLCVVFHTTIIRFSQAESSLQNSRVASPRLYTPTNQHPRKRVVSNISSPPKLSPFLGLTRGAIRLASMDQRREKSARGCQDHLSQLRVRGTKRRGRLGSEKKRFSESFRSARSETAVEESGRPFTRARARVCLSVPCSPRLRAVSLSLFLSLTFWNPMSLAFSLKHLLHI